ncbi:MAG TPA: WGR domain-containing protein [Gemmataceae bacterium]|nr:WGR domain-containing protein [Gemmataceae bacterium]
MREFTFTDDKSNKFWTIGLDGASFTVTFGRVGTKGQTHTKSFADAATAKKEHDKLVSEKIRKGYVENAVASPPAPPSMERRALEDSLAEHPDELATHSAYADYLTEQGDPRGEFIQAQLALEDESRSKEERDALRKREAALLKTSAAKWLGDAGRFLDGPWGGPGKPYQFRFVRGWPDFIRTLPVPEEIVAAIARSPECRLLRHLEIVYDMEYHPHDFDQFTAGPIGQLRDGEAEGASYDATCTLPHLAESAYVTNLRVLKYGFGDNDPDSLTHSTMVDPFGMPGADAVLGVLQKNPRLEELYLNVSVGSPEDLFSSPLLGSLRAFQFYFGTADYSEHGQESDPYPLSVLAENTALEKLTTLRLHPGRDASIDLGEFDALLRSPNLPALEHLQVHMTTFGDEGAERVVRSGILKRLKTLDLGYGNMTDVGAGILASSPDIKKLSVLNVSRNALTYGGIHALTLAGVRVVADDMHAVDETDYLYEVDRE